MNKIESLAFLQNCIDNVGIATSEEIAFLQNVYEKNCATPLVSSDFEFVCPMPTDLSTYLCKTNELVQIMIPKTDYRINTKEGFLWDYNIEGITTNNEPNGENLPYAA